MWNCADQRLTRTQSSISTKKVLGAFQSPKVLCANTFGMAPNNNLGDIFCFSPYFPSLTNFWFWVFVNIECVLLQFDSDTRMRKKHHCSFIVPRLLWTPLLLHSRWKWQRPGFFCSKSFPHSCQVYKISTWRGSVSIMDRTPKMSNSEFFMIAWQLKISKANSLFHKNILSNNSNLKENEKILLPSLRFEPRTSQYERVLVRITTLVFNVLEIANFS